MTDRELLALMSAILYNDMDHGTKQDCVDDAVDLLVLIDRAIAAGDLPDPDQQRMKMHSIINPPTSGGTSGG